MWYVFVEGTRVGVVSLPDSLSPPEPARQAFEELTFAERQIMIRMFGLDGKPPRSIKKMSLEADVLYGNIRPMIASAKIKLCRGCLAEGVVV